MRVKFLTNLGSNDAAKVGLNVADCTCGAIAEVKQGAAEFLLTRELAEEQTEPTNKQKSKEK